MICRACGQYALLLKRKTPLTRRPPDRRPQHWVTWRTATLLLAVWSGQIVGFGGRANRSGVAFLTDLFVDPAQQSSAVGKMLLGELFRGAGTDRCTLASSDARAVALYARASMTPRWPNFDLVAEALGYACHE